MEAAQDKGKAGAQELSGALSHPIHSGMSTASDENPSLLGLRDQTMLPHRLAHGSRGKEAIPKIDRFGYNV